MSRKHAKAPPPEWFPTANAIRRQLNERLAEGVKQSAMTIVMDPEHYEVFRKAGGGRWELRGKADLFDYPVIQDDRIEGWTIRIKDTAPRP